MAIKATNSVVGIEYVLTETGSSEELDGNKGGQPLEFITGFGYIIPGLESELVGLNEGDTKEVNVKAVDGYGEYSAEQVQKLPRDQFAGVELEEGMTLYGQGENGQTVQVKVTSFDDAEVEVDMNHPLAGKDLTFDVTILSERDATDDEISSGQIGGHCDTGG